MASQFKTFTAGSVLTASEVNTYLMKQAVIVCDSTADYPASPVEGMTVYDKGADALKVYTTATTGWQAPWSLPWGLVGSGTNTAGATITTTQATISGLSLTITLIANRRYKATVTIPVLKNTSTSNVVIQTFVGATGIGGASGTVGSGEYATLTSSHLFTGSGSTLITAAGSVVSDTAALNVSNVFPATLIVEDIGPNGAPA